MTREREYLLSTMTSIKIGGVLKHVFFPKNLDELGNNLRTIFDENYSFYILGGGTNTVLGHNFDDRSCIINLRNLNELSIIKKIYKPKSKSKSKGSFQTIQAGSGASLQDIVDLGYSKHLTKFDCLNRIPGSIGGAVYGNAGAYGVEIAELVENVTVINLKKFFQLCQEAKNIKKVTTSMILKNCLENYSQKDSRFSYRNSIFKTSKHEFLIVQIRLKSTQVTKKDFILMLENSYLKIAKIRDFNYPKNLRSPGSTFKNIELNTLSQVSVGLTDPNWVYKNKIPVAKILNTCDVINTPINGIKMKDNHCNILTNKNPINNLATLEDVVNYLTKLKNQVEAKYQIKLEEEIRLIDKFNSISDIINAEKC